MSPKIPYLHVISGWRKPFEEKYAASSHLDGHQGHQHPAGRVKGLQEGRGGDDPGALGHQDGDPGLQEGHGEVDDPLATAVDLERGHNDVGLVAHELGHQTVPLAVDHATPIAITHSNLKIVNLF